MQVKSKIMIVDSRYSLFRTYRACQAESGRYCSWQAPSTNRTMGVLRKTQGGKCFRVGYDTLSYFPRNHSSPLILLTSMQTSTAAGNSKSAGANPQLSPLVACLLDHSSSTFVVTLVAAAMFLLLLCLLRGGLEPLRRLRRHSRLSSHLIFPVLLVLDTIVSHVGRRGVC